MGGQPHLLTIAVSGKGPRDYGYQKRSGHYIAETMYWLSYPDSRMKWSSNNYEISETTPKYLTEIAKTCLKVCVCVCVDSLYVVLRPQ